MYSSCLVASKFVFTENQFRCLVRSNIFTKNALHSQATQFSIHFLSCKHVDNESIPHSFTKESKPSKKRKSNPVKLRSRGGGEGEIGGEIERRGAAIDNRRGAIVGLELSLWSLAKSLLPLSLQSGLSLSLSLLFAWIFSFCGSLSLLRVLRKMFEGKTIM